MEFYKSELAAKFLKLDIDVRLWPINEPRQNTMHSKIACSPPLGQISVIDRSQEEVVFQLAVGDAPLFTRSQEKEIELWHNAAGDNSWIATRFQGGDAWSAPLNLETRSNTLLTAYTCKVDVPSVRGSISFTLRWREKGSKYWTWANEVFREPDGCLILRDLSSSSSANINTYLDGSSPNLTVKPVETSDASLHLWSFTFDADAVAGLESSLTYVSLGIPKDYYRWMALVRHWSPWLGPRQGAPPFSSDKHAIVASFLRKDGRHIMFLAIGGIEDANTVLLPGERGSVVAMCRNDRREKNTGRVLVIVGWDYELCMNTLVEAARKIVTSKITKPGQHEIPHLTDGNSTATPSITNGHGQVNGANGVKSSWFQGWYDGLSYCTWNGLGRELSEPHILDALDQLERAGVHISNLIIDDNWQSLNGQRWIRFEANEENFEKGLKHCIQTIREKHKDIEQIAVWHALLGYWGGIEEGGEIAKEYSLSEVTKMGGGKMLVVGKDDCQRMYGDFYQFLRGCGITSVKTDAQFFIDEFIHADDRRALTLAYQDAWRDAYTEAFSGQVISCMSQAVPIIFHSQLPTLNPPIVVRNSDDFFPNEPRSHAWHIFANAHNVLFNSHLNMLPDWDMFQTAHPYGAYHAAARCLSGGPVYITDMPGEHDMSVIGQMTAESIVKGAGSRDKGKTVVLRPSGLGRTVEQYRGFEEGGLLAIGAHHTKVGCLLGLWNIGTGEALRIVMVSLFLPQGLLDGGEGEKRVLVRSHRSGRISGPFDFAKKHQAPPSISVQVEERDWEILTSYPVVSLRLGKSNVEIAVLGLLGKMSGVAALLHTAFEVERAPDQQRIRIDVVLKALGTLGLWLGRRASAGIASVMVMIYGQPVPLEMVSVDRENKVLQVDVLKVWKDMQLDVGMGNEVRVSIWLAEI